MKKSSRRSRRLPNLQQKDNKKQEPFFSKTKNTGVQTKAEDAFFQPKLSIGQPGDKYEQEADAMADSIVNGSNNNASIQQKKADQIQRVTLATPEKDEKLATAEGRMEEDKMIQEKPEESIQTQEEEEPVQMMEEEEESLQMMEGEEEESVQMMEGEEEESVQMMEGEEEELQAKGKTSSSNQASPQLNSNIQQQKGKGKALSLIHI